MYLLAVSIISLRSSGVVNLIPACKHCLTAASHPTREKMKVIAGNKDIRCNFSIISALDKRFESSIHREFLPALDLTRRNASFSSLSISGFTCPGFVNRSTSLLPIRTCWYNGIGLTSLTMTSIVPRTSPSHSPNSSALETVAESDITCTLSMR